MQIKRQLFVCRSGKLCFTKSAVKPFHRPPLNEELMAIKIPYIAALLFHSVW